MLRLVIEAMEAEMNCQIEERGPNEKGWPKYRVYQASNGKWRVGRYMHGILATIKICDNATEAHRYVQRILEDEKHPNY